MSQQVRIGWRSGSSSQTAASIVTSGLVLNLDAGNVSSYSGTGTTWTDLSGNNLNATLVNGTTYRTSYGGHLQFDGINDAAVLAYNTKLDPATAYRDLPFSINGWVKFDGAGGGTFMNKGDNGNHSYETYTVSILPTGLQIILYNNHSIYVTIKTTGITLNPGTWYNFATAYTGGYGTPDYQPNYNGTMKLYINGAECATTVTITGSYIKMDPINTSTFIGSFGQVGAPGSYWATSFNGSVAQTLMYNRQLTSTEVTQNYNATKTKFDLDTDAQAFLNAASITDSTQQSAINTLVTQLKTYGIWTKLKAVYPFVGGTANSHKFNLKDPRDLDAAFRLTFSGGWTHSSTGALPNGSNAYADTYLIPNTTLSTTNFHLSFYSRTISNAATTIYPTEIGSAISGTQLIGLFLYRPTNPISKWGGEGYSTTAEGTTTMDSKYFGLTSRTNSTSLKYYKNGSVLATQTGIDNGNRPNIAITIGRSNGLPNYSDRESAFASIGDGLTDTEAANFYTAIQAYQTTLGRNVGAPIVADTDAQAFLNAAEITSQTQANAVNTLVTDLKSANIWTKMKAIYPFVGGTAAQHRFNLKDPRDLDAAYRLTFDGGWTHTSTGAKPNGINASADTKLNALSVLTLNNSHLSYYSRTNSSSTNGIMGKTEIGTQILGSTSFFMGLYSYSNKSLVVMYDSTNNFIQNNETTSAVFGIGSRTSSNSLKYYRNGVAQLVTVNVSSGNYPNNNVYLGVNGHSSNKYEWSDRESAFASIGDGLSDAEATAFYTAVQKYQTSLGRQV